MLIGKSYKEWQENPIATSITTHPIDNLDIPNVTICPPKDSNTALYHDLVKVGNGPLSDENKETLKNAAHEIFTKQGPEEYVKQMSATQHMGNLDQVLKGFHSLPTPYNDANGLKIKMWNLNRTITTPWFGGDYVEEFYQWDREFLMVLDLPDDIKDQVGSGSLIIDLDFDTREEQGWLEKVSLMPNFTLHKASKTWSEAESDCQKEGGHLASVISEEVNQVVKNMVDEGLVWLGGRRTDEQWTWSDKSTWGYTNWTQDSSENCVSSGRYNWYPSSCIRTLHFICQVKKNLRGEKRISQTYTKDQLNFQSFLLSYKYKAASQHLLDSWKERRMTGFKLSWKIEKNSTLWMANISEVGRSIQTPHLDENSDATSDIFHSHWEQTMAQEAADGWPYVWLGGRKVDGQWQWEDNTTWNFENWSSDRYNRYEYQLMYRVRGSILWGDIYNSWEASFLCQGSTVALAESGLARIEFSKEQLVFFPFHVLFKSNTDEKAASNTSSAENRKISGFSLNWFLKDSYGTQVTEKLQARPADWSQSPTPAYENPLLYNMIHLAKELRLKNMSEIDMLKKVVDQKVQAKVDGQCSMGQLQADEQKHVFSNIFSNVSTGKTSGEPSDKDIETGYNLFHAVVFCLTKVSKMNTYIDQILSVDTSRTIILAIANLFQPGAISDEITFTLTRRFYRVLADTLDLQYGNILLASSTNAQIQAVIWNKGPFLTNHTDLVKESLQGAKKFDLFQGVYKNLGKLIFYSYLKFHYRCGKRLTRAVPPPGPPDS